jgi:hypothetical protein
VRRRRAPSGPILKKVAATYPDRELYFVCNNYATHKCPKVKEWLAKNPVELGAPQGPVRTRSTAWLVFMLGGRRVPS